VSEQARDRVAVALLTVATAAAHAAYGLAALARFRFASYDLVIFDQAVRGYAAFGAPIAPVKGVHNGFGPDFSVLGDHFSPILATLAPLYWIHPHPSTLIVAQAALFALAVPVVWVATRRALGRGPAYCVAAAFALAWPLQEATAVGFHEVAFAVPLTAVALERLQAQRYGQSAVAALALLLVKEDLGLVVAALGVVVALRGRRALGAALAVTGLAAVVISIKVLIPAAGGRSGYYGAYYTDLLGSAMSGVDQKAEVLLWLLAPVAFLALASPVLLLGAPMLAERFISSNPNHWGMIHHYNAYLVPVVFLAAVEVARRLPRRGQQVWAVATLVAAVVMTQWFALHKVVDGSAWRTPDRVHAMRAAAAAVPDGVTVEATNYVGPELTARTTVLLLDQTPRGADWIVADSKGRHFPFRSFAEQQARLAAAERAGFKVVHNADGYVVLHRSSQ
jgi:uncharacterized membrane protein